MKVFKGAYLNVKGQQLSYGTFHKIVINLRTVQRIKHFGEEYTIKTDDQNFTLLSKYPDKNGRLLLHKFFVKYAKSKEVIFPCILTSMEVLKFLK